MPGTSVLAMVLPANGDDPRQLTTGEVLDGSTNDIVLVARQAGVALSLISTDAVVDGSNYLWEKLLVPFGRSVYFEAVASGVNLGAAVGVTVSLYTTAGVLLPSSVLTITSLTPQRARTAALVLADNTEYVVRYKTSGLLGSAFLYSARLLIR